MPRKKTRGAHPVAAEEFLAESDVYDGDRDAPAHADEAPDDDARRDWGKTPHMFIIMLAILALFTLLTWIVPGGSYKRILDPSDPAKKRMIVDPSSFQAIASKPQGPWEMLLALQQGLIDAAPIAFLIFMASAALYLVERTGALDAAIAGIMRFTRGKGRGVTLAILVLVMYGMSFWASTGALSYEEIVLFVPVFCTLAIALGFDALVGLGISFVAVGIGFGTGTVNPFTVGVAQSVAQIPLFSGVGYRLLSCFVLTTVVVAYVLGYAWWISQKPERSLVHGLAFTDFELDERRVATRFTLQRGLVLLALLVAIGFMVVGLSAWKWSLNEIAMVFFTLAIAVGVIMRWHPNRIAETFVKGLQNAMVAAMIVGFSRGILNVLTNAKIMDTMVHFGAESLKGLPLIAGASVMLIIQQFLNLIVPSGSGQAAVSMPIMAPMGDIVGISRQTSVLIYQFGDGLSNLIWPTSYVFIGCAMAKVPVGKYYKWFAPLFVLVLIAQLILIFVALKTGYR